MLVNSNPATIMTDPGLAHATYIEPITPEIVARIIEKERPSDLLPTMGGQTALNTAMALVKDGTLQGLARTDRPAFCFQGHPEASPGPHDIAYLFDRFTALMAETETTNA